MTTKYALTAKLEDIVTKKPYILQAGGTLDEIINELLRDAQDGAYPVPNEVWPLDEDGDEDINATEPLHRDCTPEEVLEWARGVLDVPNRANIKIELTRALSEEEKTFCILSQSGQNGTEKITYRDYELEKLEHVEIPKSAELLRIWISSPHADEDEVSGIAVQRFSNPEKWEPIDYHGEFWRWERWLSEALGMPEDSVEILLDGEEFTTGDVEVIASITKI